VASWLSPEEHLEALDGAGAILALDSLALFHQAFSHPCGKFASFGLKWDQNASAGMEGWVCYGAGLLWLVFSHPVIWEAFGGVFALKSPSCCGSSC